MRPATRTRATLQFPGDEVANAFPDPDGTNQMLPQPAQDAARHAATPPAMRGVMTARRKITAP